MAYGDFPSSQLIVPVVTTAVRDTMVCEVGTLIFNFTTKKLNICVVETVASSASWEVVTSA
jgi:hypothetical protein